MFNNVLQCFTRKEPSKNVLQCKMFYNVLQEKNDKFPKKPNVLQCFTMDEDKIKSQNVNVRVDLNTIIDIKKTGEKLSDFIRSSIDEKLFRDSGDFLQQRKKEILVELRKIENIEKLQGQKKSESKQIPEKEIEWLIETKKLFEERPEVLVPRIASYIKVFGKLYNVSKKEFIDLMQEAETQFQEKGIILELRS